MVASIAARGAAVSADLFAPRRCCRFHWIWIVIFFLGFVAGSISLVTALLFNMDQGEEEFIDPWGPQPNATATQVDDPGVSVLQNASSDEELPPPSAYHGILRQIPIGSTVKSLLKNLFHIDYDIPGLVRVFNSWDEIVHADAKIENFQQPRHLFVALSSYTVFLDVELLLQHSQSDTALTRVEEVRTQRINVRFFFQFFSAFRAYDQAQSALQKTRQLLTMQSVINDNMERRIAQLEHLLRAHGLDNRLPPGRQSWTTPTDGPLQPEPEDDIFDS